MRRVHRKVAGWPVVLPNDNGIRPAGKPDECFYCNAKVGHLHGPRCVTVEQLVRYDVLFNGQTCGTYILYEPHHWDAEKCNGVRNHGHWCADNAMDGIAWNEPSVQAKVEAVEGCACGVLTFRHVAVIDAGPFIEVLEEDDVEPIIVPVLEA